MFLKGEEKSEKSIELQTSLGKDIPNLQLTTESSLLMQKQISQLKSKYIGVIFKSAPSSLYNCHGMTFANRRTGIYEVENITAILEDDKYFQIDINNILAGDIVLYYSDNGDIEHSGIVVEINNTEPVDIKILSKWGDAHETIHSLYLCPYELKYIKFYRTQL